MRKTRDQLFYMAHTKARGPHPFYPQRLHVADEDVDWKKGLSYNPVNFTHSDVIAAIGKWAWHLV